ncbi:50S ribosomal protein L25/general stress protein Ctc [Jannaschia rubra]|uniref:50S ribosomal protein L25/general stress protein Ctc n=1 Tax=Jannaschia rubra TaxID=282197 RepID=UPI002492BE5A|nr:50S ribosomal protein L25/general stress protein Ctc [Jannaschia rubra]
MANEIPDLVAHARTGTGKGAARQSRRNGMVPGVVYGGGADPVAIELPFNELLAKLHAGRFRATLWNLKLEGHDDVRVIARDVQRDKVKDLPTHVDLMRLRRTSKVNLFIPVVYEGVEGSPGDKKGGVLTIVRPEVELRVTAGDIPESITVDCSKMEIGDTVTISDVTLPEGSRPTIDRDFVLANMQAPSGLASQKDEDEDEVVETEVINQTADTVEGEDKE